MVFMSARQSGRNEGSVEKLERLEKTSKHSGISVASAQSSGVGVSDHSYASLCHPLTPDVARELVSRTEDRVNRVVRKSALRKRRRLQSLPKFNLSDLNIGEYVAGGGFSDVYSIKSFKVETELANKMDAAYVLKHLNPKLASNPKKLAVGAKDLAMEAHFLSALDHEHIIKLQGWCRTGITGFVETGRVDAFFLIFDRLEETLSHRIGAWHQEARIQLSQPRTRSSTRRKFFAERVQAGIDIASALEYLHSNRIIYRDIKPGNIGFDYGGQLKLFDFGLAVELPEESNIESTFNLPGKTGTARYMAVEVIESKPYNLKADVFSFSVLLWEMMALQKPYQGIPGVDVMEMVVKHARPEIPKEWPSTLRTVLKRGWAAEINDRPPMTLIKKHLIDMRQKCLQKTGDGQRKDPSTSSGSTN